MSENTQVLELLTRIQGEMKEGFKKIDQRFDDLNKRIDTIIDERLYNIEKTVFKIEHEHSAKLKALCDIYLHTGSKKQIK